VNEGGSGVAPAPDKTSFRYALGHFPTGVTVMTTSAAGRLHVMTVSAFASVSLEPLLILVSVERSTLMHQLVLESRAFAINILGKRSESTARYFADNARLAAPANANRSARSTRCRLADRKRSKSKPELVTASSPKSRKV